MIGDSPGARKAIWRLYVGALPLPTYHNYLGQPGLGLHPDFSDDNPNMQGGGTHGLAFMYSPDGYDPGIKWTYDRFWGVLGDQSWDFWRHGEIYSILFYPTDAKVVAQNPKSV